jgi:hypothetical protein
MGEKYLLQPFNDSKYSFNFGVVGYSGREQCGIWNHDY